MNDQDAIGIFSSSRVAMVLTNPRLEDNPIVYVNRAFERLTGYSADASVGRNCRFLQGDETTDADLELLRRAVAAGEDVSITLTNYRADGSKFLNSLLISPVTSEEEAEPVYFLGLQREVREDARADSLTNMDRIVAEIQHRVKNHLSMIVGLVRLHARKDSAPEAFEDVSRRIESLQLLYEELSGANSKGNEDRVKLGAYLGRVAAAIAHLDGRPGVRMNVDIAPTVVGTEMAVRIGLVVSELLTNAMQHAFRGQESGLVEIRVTETDDGGVRTIITDDGIGLPEGSQWPNGESLGGQIVLGLCEGLGATLNVSRGAVGTVITFDVPQARH